MELKPFNGNTMQAQVWLSTLEHYYTVLSIIYIATEAVDTEEKCQYTVKLMGGNIVR